ncbi:MAG: hypothetical protein V4494_07710 [Chlamydiota bacterium]
MFFPLIAASALINLSANSISYEYPLQSFVEEVQDVFTNQSPFADEFLPFLEGGIDIIGFFTANLNEDFQLRHTKLKNDFTDFCSDPNLLSTVIADCKNLRKFPKLRFAKRIEAFENATEYLEERCSFDLMTLSYADRVYIYGAVRALNEIHDDLCDYVCGVYDNDSWEDYFDFDDVAELSYLFLLNPTLQTQYNLQLGLSILKAKIHNL